MSSSISETEPVSAGEELRQGDILELLSSNGDLRQPRYGLVINADCDLAHHKIDGILSYLPIFSFAEYFQYFVMPMYFDNRKREIAQSVCRDLGLEVGRQSELIEWIQRDGAAAVLQKCINSFCVRKSGLEIKLKELATILSKTDSDNDNLIRLIVKISGDHSSAVVEKIGRNALRNLGDGQLFVNEIRGLADLGYVIRMRRIYSLVSSNIFRSYADYYLENISELCAVRIARLTHLYRFKAAQIFAQQFSRIGLPDELTSLNELAVDAAVDSLLRIAHA